jgi:hypothetical protein
LRERERESDFEGDWERERYEEMYLIWFEDKREEGDEVIYSGGKAKDENEKWILNQQYMCYFISL